MSGLSIQQILSSRYKTSAEGERHTIALMNGLGLSTKANVARLSISRSLAMGAFRDGEIDAKGMDIPAASLFSQDDSVVWIGLIVTHGKMHGQEVDSHEAFRNAVRHHWHRGVMSLMEDWKAVDGNYDRFLETMINRRAELPDVASRRREAEGAPVGAADKPVDVSAQLVKALADIGVIAEIRGFAHGPRVTRYKVFLTDINQLDKLRKGLERLSLVLSLQNALPSLSHGDEAKTVFLDVPRPKPTWTTSGVHELQEWIKVAQVSDDQLVVFPGVDVMGKPYSLDIATAPHLLVGGATGMGKSVCLHALILSLILQHSSSNLRLALIDPKQVEFSVYQNSGYLYGEDIATTSIAAKERILELVAEMEARYQQFSMRGVTNISEARRQGLEIPYVVVFIEELADLIMQDKDVEGYIVRLAQKARAAGIHLVLATQRPDAKTFSGLIRSNVPARIALTVQKGSESTIILDETGAENLLGAGDMLIKTTGGQAERAHGLYVTRKDIESVVRKRAKAARR
ncbi:MAG: FtsK/SpoIIIE domain-containing protein [Pseudomonadales bacterium]